jgi:hypothetical protein
LLRPFYPQFPTLSAINEVQSIGNSVYNGLVASLRMNAWHGLTSQFSYTFGHSIDDASAIRNLNPANSFNVRNDRGPSTFDVRHTFSSYITYLFPTPSRGPKRLVGGWQLNSLILLYTGLPYTVFSGRNVSGTFEGRDRADLVGDPYAGVQHKIVTASDGSKYEQWVNPAAFAQPAPGTFGNIGRNSLRGPNFATVDFAVVKNTPITERVNAQFRVEMFNLFNRKNLPIPGPIGSAPPSDRLSSSSFGRITDTIGDYLGATGIGSGEPFNVQLALKIIF